jgi:Na+/proline symporter
VTCLYTAIGGIKSVIWTEIIQSSLMFGSAVLAIFTLLYHLSESSFNFTIGFNNLLVAVPALKDLSGYVVTGFEAHTVEKFMVTNNLSEMSLWQYMKLILVSDYTVFSAVIGATLGNMAAFGTDQAMVQRMLTAESYQKARKSLITAALMTFPIAVVFSLIGVLLYAFFEMYPQEKPASSSDVFGAYILGSMPVGVRGIVLAGLFATAMGSFSAALNSLATSATNDIYLPYLGKKSSEEKTVQVARILTVVFAVLMILIATLFAWAKVAYPNLRIIPIVLGIAGFILGPMLGIFLLGMLTKSRGSDTGNIVAIGAGLLTTIILSKIPFDLLALRFPNVHEAVAWIPKVSFTWFALLGAMVVFGVGVLFRTPTSAREQMAHRLAECSEEGYEDTPLAMRSGPA